MKQLADHNFITEWKGDKQLVYKANASGRLKKLGKVYDDESGVFFYSDSDDIFPFKAGKNFFDNDEGTISVPNPKKPTKNPTRYFTNQEFEKATQKEHTLLAYFDKVTDKPLKNLYGVRGVKNAYASTLKNYLANEVVFPYYNSKNEFQSAKIIAYENGKRKKNNFSTNWFHSYKPIKKELNVTGDINKPKNVWFGEHLISNSNNIAIVESEKTAIVFSELYSELDVVFLATGSLTNLFSLDYSLLKGKNVTVFADKGVSQWQDEAIKNNWYFDTTIENSTLEKGDDILDALGTDVFVEVENAIQTVANKVVSLALANDLHADDKARPNALQFQYVPSQQTQRCFPNLRELGFSGYEDNCDIMNPSAKPFEARYFKFYPARFEALSCNLDINEWYQDKLGVWNPPNEEVFLSRLEKIYRVAKHINSASEDISWVRSFTDQFFYVLQYFNDNSNFRFNINFVLTELVPSWNDNNNISEYISKPRNWRIKPNTVRIPRRLFPSWLAEDRRIYATNTALKIISEHIDQHLYISHKNALELTRRSDNELVWDIAENWNKNVMGCTTINQWETRFRIIEYLSHLGYKNTKLYINLLSPYSTIYIETTQKCTILKPMSILAVSNAINLDRRQVKQHINFEPSKKAEDNSKVIVEFLLSKPDAVKFERVEEKRKNGKIKKTIKILSAYSLSEMKDIIKSELEAERNGQEYTELQREENMNVQVAFEGEITDWKLGVFGCSEEEAITRSRVEGNSNFLFEWYLVNSDAEFDVFDKMETRNYAEEILKRAT